MCQSILDAISHLFFAFWGCYNPPETNDDVRCLTASYIILDVLQKEMFSCLVYFLICDPRNIP